MIRLPSQKEFCIMFLQNSNEFCGKNETNKNKEKIYRNMSNTDYSKKNKSYCFETNFLENSETKNALKIFRLSIGKTISPQWKYINKLFFETIKWCPMKFSCRQSLALQFTDTLRSKQSFKSICLSPDAKYFYIKLHT